MTRILVIDDEPEVRDLIARMLEGVDREIVTAANGVEGLAIFDGQAVDVVITDIIMPEKEGIETILELKGRDPDVRIIAISGGGRISPEDHLRTAEALGARASVAKPFTRAQLLGAVELALS
jgi:CheY-like chemotaxis protein